MHLGIHVGTFRRLYKETFFERKLDKTVLSLDHYTQTTLVHQDKFIAEEPKHIFKQISDKSVLSEGNYNILHTSFTHNK